VQLPIHDGQGNDRLLLVSFHATSGFGAAQNCTGYFDGFYGFDPMSQRQIPSLWIVGGDFNCNRPSGIFMPPTFTHQSRSILDGFFADQNGTDFEISASAGPFTCININGGMGELITDTNRDPHGYVFNNVHLSDHCPVWAEFRIQRASQDMNVDTGNIVYGRRNSRPPARYRDNS
jgi:hypothetical protein